MNKCCKIPNVNISVLLKNGVCKVSRNISNKVFKCAIHVQTRTTSKYFDYCVNSIHKKKLLQRIFATASIQEYKLFSSADIASSKDAADTLENGDRKINYNTQTTHTCGELTIADTGKHVRLCGWIRYRRLNKFILLWDMHGITQILISRDNGKLKQIVSNLSLESTICVEGIVCARPFGTSNLQYNTGEIEVLARSIIVISKATAQLPFQITEYNKAREALLNRYRPLALRFSEYRNNIMLYAKLESKMREFLDKNGFVNIPTPTLFKATPGGAQEFVVPTREKDRYYSLVQSPQQFKQMLMISGFDRYYQFARCYRDERTTPDRQPEFTQLDLEMSYTTVDGVIKLVEDILYTAWPATGKPSIAVPFPRLKFDDVMESYGVDKPWILDVMKINNVTQFFIPNNTNDFSAVIKVPNFSNMTADTIASDYLCDDNFRTNLSSIRITDDWNASKTAVSNVLPEFQMELFREKVCLRDGDILIVSRGFKHQVLEDLGSIRKNILTALVKSNKLTLNTEYEFMWIVDFPLFLQAHCDGSLKSAHHPFTQPHPDDITLLHNEPLKVRALHYDLVMNGCEIGGGSIRIHDYTLQSEIFKLLKIPEEIFSHLIQSMKCGCPSMGGIALGMERLVMLISKARSIRDVTAFPKGSEGQDLMADSPCDIPLKDKILYHLTETTPNNASDTSLNK